MRHSSTSDDELVEELSFVTRSDTPGYSSDT